VPFGGSRRLVGLGFGPIQAGLFVYEAQRTGAYAPPLIVDVRADLVAALREAGGHVAVNIAHHDHIERVVLGPIVVADSSVPEDRDRIVAAIADADELTTALPSVAAYRGDTVTSPHRLIAEGLARRTRPDPLLILCAENHRDAAALLEDAVLDGGAAERDRVRDRMRCVDTVIGKMSGIVDDATEVGSLGLATITPAHGSAFLVESFDRILVSRAETGGGRFDRILVSRAVSDGGWTIHPGMPVLREVDDLAPFEDAKLLGHNAIHAMAGFLGMLLGLRRMADMVEVPGFGAYLRAAFVEESGAALIARHGGADPLFTPEGYAAFADDLLTRMVNPYLADTMERAARDPARKLAWDDRLVGLIRVGLAEGVATRRIAMGAAAGLEILAPGLGPDEQLAAFTHLWPTGTDPTEAIAVRHALSEGITALGAWRRAGFVESD
jgi:mannitol-1-phosphate 5-dehydrogenase